MALFKFYFGLLLLALALGGAGYLMVSAIRLFWRARRILTRPTLVDTAVRTVKSSDARPRDEVDNRSISTVITPMVENKRSRHHFSDASLAVPEGQISVVDEAKTSSLPRSEKEWDAYKEPTCKRRPRGQLMWV